MKSKNTKSKTMKENTTKGNKNKWKKACAFLLTSALLISGLTGCNSAEDINEKAKSDVITVISREDGSGTRGAFVELFGIEQKNASGEKEDMTTEEASVTNSTSVMMTTVAGNPNAIGYVSLGSLNDSVKAVKIDGVFPSVVAIKDGSYKISRPFHVVTNGALANEAAKDFLNYILSAEGQRIVETNGYIAAVDNAPTYEKKAVSGKVVVAGSSSVTPVMEKLKEAYVTIQPDVTVEVQMSDSSTGVNYAIDGTCDLGMASRELKSSELEKGATSIAIALDGIAVIVNTNNTVQDLTVEQVRDIYMGRVYEWSQLE